MSTNNNDRESHCNVYKNILQGVGNVLEKVFLSEYLYLRLLCTQQSCVPLKTFGIMQEKTKFDAEEFYKILSEKILNCDKSEEGVLHQILNADYLGLSDGPNLTSKDL